MERPGLRARPFLRLGWVVDQEGGRVRDAARRSQLPRYIPVRTAFMPRKTAVRSAGMRSLSICGTPSNG